MRSLVTCLVVGFSFDIILTHIFLSRSLSLSLSLSLVTAAATEIVQSKGLETAQSLQTAYAEQFGVHPNLTAVAAQYAKTGSTLTDKNAALSTTLSITVDAVDTVLTQLGCMEQYITLTIPKMEDGNNFGVTVQLAALKHINDTQDKLIKQLEELLKYSAARADVLEKCKSLSPNESKTVVTTASESQGTSTGPNKETKVQETVPSSDNKTSTATTTTVSTVMSSPELGFRTQAITDLDIMYYSKAKVIMQTCLTGYLAALDFLQKNSDKLAAPKGTSGTTAYHSMY
jgi:Proteasome activator pa28 beta subunit